MEANWQRSRIYLKYNTKLHGLIWIDEGLEGSIYLGPYTDSDRKLKIADLQSKSSTVKYHNFIFDKQQEHTKISFHTPKKSQPAQVHERSFFQGDKTTPVIISREDISSDLDNPKLVAHLVIPHFNNLPTADIAINPKKDLVIPADEFPKQPIAAKLILTSPSYNVLNLMRTIKGSVGLGSFKSTRYQLSLIFYTNKAFTKYPPFLIFGIKAKGA